MDKAEKTAIDNVNEMLFGIKRTKYKMIEDKTAFVCICGNKYDTANRLSNLCSCGKKMKHPKYRITI